MTLSSGQPLRGNPAIVDSTQGRYGARARYSLAEAPGLRVRRLDLDAGQIVPWHHHTHITETFFCMEGPMKVKTRSPDAVHVLGPGETCEVPPGQAHRVSGVADGACRFMSVQGVGTYDFIRVED